MEYWTVMIFTVLGGFLDGAQFSVPFEILSQCEAATAQISATLPYDHNVACRETQTTSASIRPMTRPEGLGNE